MLIINGAYGEGGGQIVRTALALAAILNQSVRLDNIRTGRQNPGLAAQHLTAVRAAAMICDASLSGDKLGSTQLTFEPQSPPIAGVYKFDVTKARAGGSAGSATLVLQTILLPLALAGDSSIVMVKGGTHVPWSPSFHYLDKVYLPMLARLDIHARAELLAWGWYPAGGGEITATINGQNAAETDRRVDNRLLEPIGVERGPLKTIKGVAVSSSLPAHIAQRIRNRAINLLTEADLPANIEPLRVRSVSPGAGIFLWAEYESGRAGFSALGRKGKPSEQVAEEAVNDLLVFHRSGAVLDEHLSDQLILPLALSGYAGSFSTTRLTQHTLTNIWVVEQFLGQQTEIDHKRRCIRFKPRENDSF